jgi:hypothetical protein
MSKSAGRSAIVGVGYSKILRDKGIDGRPLAVEASRTAIADAGLTVGDVDAVFEYAGDEQAMDIARMVGIDNIAVYGDYTPRGRPASPRLSAPTWPWCPERARSLCVCAR